LKRVWNDTPTGTPAEFLYIDPLKQGLKLQSFQGIEDLSKLFLYIDPLKQGLKPA